MPHIKTGIEAVAAVIPVVSGVASGETVVVLVDNGEVDPVVMVNPQDITDLGVDITPRHKKGSNSKLKAQVKHKMALKYPPCSQFNQNC